MVTRDFPTVLEDPSPSYPKRELLRHNLAEVVGRAVLPCGIVCQSIL